MDSKGPTSKGKGRGKGKGREEGKSEGIFRPLWLKPRSTAVRNYFRKIRQTTQL